MLHTLVQIFSQKSLVDFGQEITSSPALLAVLLSFVVGQFIKVGYFYLRRRRWDWSLVWSASGMPSTHASSVSSLATVIGLRTGFNSYLFAIALTFAIIVMYDARGVRRAAGEQAEALNYLLDIEADIDHREHKVMLEQRIGHTFPQVIAGAVLGLLLGLSVNYFVG